MTAPTSPPEWKIDTLDDARHVIGILHRWSIQDIEHINKLSERVTALEAPLRTRLWRKLRDR